MDVCLQEARSTAKRYYKSLFISMVWNGMVISFLYDVLGTDKIFPGKEGGSFNCTIYIRFLCLLMVKFHKVNQLSSFNNTMSLWCPFGKITYFLL